jgi:hypothetical protein
MTIRNSVNISKLNDEMSNYQACAEQAPKGTYEDVKETWFALNEIFGDLFTALKDAGFKVNPCDGFREIEVLIYGMLKEANPDKWVRFAVGEGFGSHMGTDTEELVLENTTRDRDFIRQHKLFEADTQAIEDLLK